MSDGQAAARRTSAGRVLGFVFAYWRRLVPGKFALMVVGVAAGVLLEVQVPRFSADLTSAVERHLVGAGSLDLAKDAGLALVVLFALVFLVKQLYLRVWMYLASQVMQRMVMGGFERVQRYSASWHANNFAGATQRRITRGMWAYDSLADNLVVDLGPAVALLAGFSIAMFLRDPLLGSYFLVAVVLFLSVSIWLSLAYVAPANQLSNDADTTVGGALADSITCNATVKAFGAEQREAGLIEDASQHWRRVARRSWLRSMDAGAVQSVMLVLLLGGLLGIVLLVPGEDGRLRVDDVVYVIATYLMVNSYLRNIGWQVRSAQRAINELDDLVEIADTLPQVADAQGAPDFVPGPGEIRFAGVRFAYPNQPRPVFDGLEVHIRAGEQVALVGESGAGKSTFAKLLQRLHDLDAGRITVDGQDVAAVTQASLRQAIALVPQEPILFHRSLAANIGYAAPGATQADIERAARLARADAFIDRLPEGYATLVGERGVKLSGGERQRVAIARAILADARVLVLDEATSSLDSVTEQLIQDALTDLLEGRTAIIIAHRLATVRRVDRVLVFDAGRIIEEGNHAELMARPDGHYRRLVEMQAFALAEDSAAAG